MSEPLSPPQRRRGRTLLFVGGGCAVLLVIALVLIVGCLAAIDGGRGDSTTGSGKGGKQAEATVAVGQSVAVGDSSWTVTSARPTTQLTDQFGTQSKQGNFVVVDFDYTNNANEAKTLSQTIINLYDSRNRKSSPDTDTLAYVPNDKNVFLNQVNPGVTKNGEVVFSVAPGASGFKLEVADTNLFSTSGKGYVDLGF